MSTIESLKRAQADVKAANTAKRGMFCLLEQRHSYMSQKTGHHAYSRFVPGIVTSINREGVAQRVSVFGRGDLRLDRKDWHECHVDSRRLVIDPAGVALKLTTEYGVAIEFETLALAQTAIKTAAGLA